MDFCKIPPATIRALIAWEDTVEGRLAHEFTRRYIEENQAAMECVWAYQLDLFDWRRPHVCGA